MSLAIASGYGFEKPTRHPRDSAVWDATHEEAALFKEIPKQRYADLIFGLARLTSTVSVAYKEHSVSDGPNAKVVDMILHSVEQNGVAAQEAAAGELAREYFFEDADLQVHDAYNNLLAAYDEVVASTTVGVLREQQ